VVATLLEVNRDKILALIKSQEIEQNVKQNSKIHVITASEEDKAYLERFFEEVGIAKVSYAIGKPYQPIASDIDLVIFDDHRDTKADHDLFNEYIQNSDDEKPLFVFFGKHFNAINREKVNYSNSKFTLYNQVVNSLKYNELRSS
jgi:hypothetical protein